jgi:hypothetical protein
MFDNVFRLQFGQQLADLGPLTHIDPMDIRAFSDVLANNPSLADSRFYEYLRKFVESNAESIIDDIASVLSSGLDGIFDPAGENFLDFKTNQQTNLQRFESMFGDGVVNPDGAMKVKNGGGFKWVYGPASKFAGQDYQPGGDQDGDGDIDPQDKRIHDADLYDRIAKGAELDGNTWKANHYRAKAEALQKEADARPRKPAPWRRTGNLSPAEGET